MSRSKISQKITAKSRYSANKTVTDKLRSYGAAHRELKIEHLHDTTNRLNNRAESSHVPIPRRERKLQRCKSYKSTQIFLSIYGLIYNFFNTLRQLRSIAMAEWDLVINAA